MRFKIPYAEFVDPDLELHHPEKLIDQMLRHHTSEVSFIPPERTKIRTQLLD